MCINRLFNVQDYSHTFNKLSMAEKNATKSLKQKKQKKIAKLRQSCDSFCVHNMQETFVCTIASDDFYLHDSN